MFLFIINFNIGYTLRSGNEKIILIKCLGHKNVSNGLAHLSTPMGQPAWTGQSMTTRSLTQLAGSWRFEVDSKSSCNLCYGHAMPI